MFSIKFVTNMFYLILVLQHCNYLLQDCAATEMSIISKKADIATSTVNPRFKHLLNTGILDSDSNASKIELKTQILNKEPQDYSYEGHKDIEINQKVEDLRVNPLNEVNAAKQNERKESFVSNNATIDLSKLMYLKFAKALKNELHQIIAQAFLKYSQKSNSSEVNSDITPELNDAPAEYITNGSEKISEEMQRMIPKEKAVSGRQFVFHPYLPYGKDVAPDEKISIGDVLPFKMVKFFKGMVEDAPWEQMFMKMVRMIVDQFVDKIIEKMFAHKDDHDEWRSSDGGSAKSAWSIPKKVLTFVVRSRRSIEEKTKSERVQDWIEKDLSSANRVSKEDRSKTKEPKEEESWLDSILDYLFPDDPKAADVSEEGRRKRRDTNQSLRDSNHQISGIMRSFLSRYLKFQTEQLSPESMNAIVEESIRHKMSEITSQYNSNNGDSKLSAHASSSMSENATSDTSLGPQLADSVVPPAESSSRTKRSTEEDEEEDRLWQANRRSRPSNHRSRDDCSLRRACNAGRLLSRLPSVQDITMQLKTYGNEPHWDALLWGMTKKRCSRIFCKRQRSPKGAKHHWDGPEKHFLRKSTPSSRRPRLKYDESDLTSI